LTVILLKRKEGKRRIRKASPATFFLNDCFFVLDYFKLKNKELYDFSRDAKENKGCKDNLWGLTH